MIRLKNTTYIDWRSLEFVVTDIFVDEETISFTEPIGYDKNQAQEIDCSGKTVTKSFGCGHHHSYLTYVNGMPLTNKQPNTFYELLKYKWWKLDKSLTKEMIKAAAYSTAIDCAKNGMTFIVDHHSSPNFIKGSLQIISDAFNDVGISHLLSYEISDRDGVNIAKQALNETRNYLEHSQGLVGLHSSFTLTDNTLQKAANLAKEFNTGVHVHLAEDLYDQEHCYDIHNMRVVERFQKFGILELPKSIFVHCLYLTTDERRLLSESKAYIAQNIESNLINNEGEFSSCHLGRNIMLGLDGVHNDILRAAKATYFCGQHSDTIDTEETYRRFRQIHHYLSKNEFNGDGDNNLVVLDYNPATEFNQQNFHNHFIHGIESRQVIHVISNGKLIVSDGATTLVNEKDHKLQAQAMSKELWNRMKLVRV